MRLAPRPFACTLCALAAFLAACTAANPPGESAEQRANELIARRVMAVWESADTSALVELFGPNAVYDDFPNQIQYHGIAEIIGHVLSVQSWATNISMDVLDVHTGPSVAVAEWTLSATQDRPLGNLVPQATNREVVLAGATILQIEGGRITRAADYWDMTPMVLQLGGRITFPGGAVWQQDPDTTMGAGR